MIVPEPKFYLKNIKTNEPTLICLQAKYDGNRVFLSTGNKVNPKEWDFVTQRAKVLKRNLANGDINLWLDKMANEFKSTFRSLQLDGIFPEAKLVMSKMQGNLQMIAKPKIEEKLKLDLFSFIAQYIAECNSTKAFSTVKSYITTFNHLKSYSLAFPNQFSFNHITLEWRAGFIKYLQSCGISRTTEGKHIKIVKVFMNEATERGLNSNMDFKRRNFSKPHEDVIKIFLTKDEIHKLSLLDLSKDKTKDIVRDYFIISCMTSLRYSDFTDIKPENIKGETIKLITKKTGEEVIIPMATLVKDIFNKYNFNLPKAPCNQIFNRVLKEVGKLSGLNEFVTVTKTVGGIKKVTSIPKYKLLTCHTGRRTMISNSILAGIPTSSIMLISAHKNLKVFQNYVKIEQQQNADVLAEHAFFMQ